MFEQKIVLQLSKFINMPPIFRHLVRHDGNFSLHFGGTILVLSSFKITYNSVNVKNYTKIIPQKQMKIYIGNSNWCNRPI